jgi:hypothetical protein
MGRRVFRSPADGAQHVQLPRRNPAAVSYRFLDATIVLPRTPAAWLQASVLPAVMGAICALGALLLWGPTLGVLLVALGAVLGAALPRLGISVYRTPRAYLCVLAVTAAVLGLGLMLLLR